MSAVAECLVAFLFGSVVGLLVQRSRFCNTAALRDGIMFKTYRNTKAVLVGMMILSVTEFGSRLEAAGLPSDAVRTLTRLFESVRYGGQRSDPKMANEAVACLTSILQHCGEPA